MHTVKTKLYIQVNIYIHLFRYILCSTIECNGNFSKIMKTEKQTVKLQHWKVRKKHRISKPYQEQQLRNAVITIAASAEHKNRSLQNAN